MAYNPVFTFAFNEAYTNGLRGIPCRTRVTLSRLDWALPVVEILPGGEPLEWEWANSDDDIFSPVRPLKLTLNLVVQDYWNPDLLNATGRYDIQVLVEKDRINSGTFQVAFMGWVQPDDSKDAYGPRPYNKTIYATDGLQLLDQKSALGPDGKPIAGPLQTLSGILQACLLRTGLNLPMTSVLNLFHLADMAAGQLENGKPAAGKDPLYQTQINTDWLIDDQNSVRSALDVIKGILTPFGCQLCQWDGQWWVRRIAEADGQHDPYNGSKQTIHLHKYVDQSTPYDAPLPGGVSLNPFVYVGARESGELIRVIAGGPATGLTSVLEALRVEQTFGRALDRLNANFGQLDGTNLPVGWQRLHKTPQQAYGVGTGSETDPFAVVITGYGDQLLALDQPGIYKVLEFDQQSTTFAKQQKFTIKGKFLLNKLRAAQITVWGVRLPDSSPRQELVLLDKDGKWLSNPSKKNQVTIRIYHDYENGTRTLPGPSDFSITTSDPIDRLIKLVVKLGVGEDLDKPGGGALEDPNAFTKFWDVRLENEQQNVVAYTGQGITYALPGRVKPEVVATLTLGDTPDAANPYGVNSTLFDRAGNATGKWFEAGSSALDGSDPGRTVLRVLGDDQARQKTSGQPDFEGELVGQLPLGPLSMLLIGDVGEVDSYGLFQPYPLNITRWHLLDKSAIHTVTATRIASKDGPIPAPAPPAAKPDWTLSGGTTVPQVADDAGLPVPLPASGILPPLPPGFSALLPILRGLLPGGINPIIAGLPGAIYDKGNTNGNALVIDAGTGAAPITATPVYRPLPDLPELL